MQPIFFNLEGNAREPVPMSNTSNVTENNSTTGTEDSTTEYTWEFLSLLVIMLFGMTGNILVCMAISMEKRLQNFTNYFLLSLAVTDLLVAAIVMPLSIVHEFFGYWPFDYVVCDFYVTSDVLMCTSSILHLCTISLERFLAICSPLSVRNKSKGIVTLKIVLVWALSLAITSPITILGYIDHKNVLNNRVCALTNDYFIIYGSTLAFFIPLGIMVITYGLTVRLLHKKSKMCGGYGSNSEGQPIIRRSISRRRFHKPLQFSPRRTQSCPNKSCDDYYPSRTSSVKSCLSVPGHELTELEVSPPPSPLYSNTTHELDPVIEENHNGVSWRTSSVSSGTTYSMSSNESPKRLKTLVRKHQLVQKATSILLLRREPIQQSPRHDQNDVNTERKASKTLGVVFAIFVICWAPFFIVNIMTVLCEECDFHPLLITSFQWLGYFSSVLNPIIYTMFNKTFRMTFVKLLRCQYGNIQKSLRVRWHSRNGYQSTFKSHVYFGAEDRHESKL